MVAFFSTVQIPMLMENVVASFGCLVSHSHIMVMWNILVPHFLHFAPI